MSKSEIAVGVATGAVAGAGAAFGYQAWRRIAERDTVDGRPVELRRVDPKSVSADPEAFQFKSGGDSHGVTDRLKSVEKWNPTAAGKAMVFEKMDGSQVIADGHQRLGLAQRLISKGQEGIKLDAYVMRERDGWTPRDVRAYAAIKNMHESSGQALDMAKVMRERPDLVTKSLPLSDAKVKDAMSLSKLSDAAFRMVVGGVVKPEHAVAVGEAVGDTSRHEGMIKEMAKADIGSAQHARLYVGQAMAAPTITEHTASLFGEETNTRSLLKERAAVLDKALVALKSDKRIFGLLEREAGNIESVGNKLSHEANAAKAEGAGRTAALIEKLATTRGVVSDMIDQAARAVADGKKPAAAARAFVKQVGDTLKSGGIQALMADGPRTQEMFGSRKWQSVVTKEDIQAAKEKLRGTTPEAKEKWGKILDSVPVDAKQAAKRRDGMEKASGKANPIRVQRMEEGPKGQKPIEVGTTYTARRQSYTVDKIEGGKVHVTMQGGGKLAYDERQFRDQIMNGPGASTRKGGQSSMFGEATMADKIAAANRAIDAKGRTGDAMNEGLFGSGKLQADLVDMAKQAPKPYVDPAYKLVGTDRTLERGLVNVYVKDGQAYVGAVNGPIDVDGRPSGLRQAPSGINLAAAQVEPSHRFHGMYQNGDGTSKTFEPVGGKGPAGWSDAARDASAEARKADPNAAERARIADGTKRIGDTYKAPAPAAPTAADKFTSGMKPMAAAKAKAALETQVRHNGKEFLSRAALVEREIANGATVQTMKIAGKDQRVLMGKDGAFLDTRNITKAGLDYAEHLSAMKPSNPNYTPGVGTKQESYWGAKAGPTPTVNELPEGAFKGTQRDFESLSPGMRREIARLSAAKAAEAQPGIKDSAGNVWVKQAGSDAWSVEKPAASVGTLKMVGIPADGSKPFTMAIMDMGGSLADQKARAQANFDKTAHMYTQKLSGFELHDGSGKPVGWSDEARAASAEARKADMKPSSLTPAEMKTVERAMTSGRGEKVSKQQAALVARASNEQVRVLDDKAMVARRANAMSDAHFNKLQDFRSLFREHAKRTSDAAFNASMGAPVKTDAPVTVEKAEKFKGTPIPPKPNATSEAERAGRINRLQNRAGAGGLSGKEAEAFVASNLAKLEALDAKRAAPAAPTPKPAAKPRVATPEAAQAAINNMFAGKGPAGYQVMTSDGKVHSRYDNREAAKAAAKNIPGAFSAPHYDEAHGSGLRGTQNEANRNAIIKNRKANAKPDKASALSNAQRQFQNKYGGDADMMRHATAADLMKMVDGRMPAKAAFAELDRIKSSGGAKPKREVSIMGRNPYGSAPGALTQSQKDAMVKKGGPAPDFKAAEVAAKTAATPTKGAGRKAMGLLAPVAIGAAAMVAANNSAKAGESKVQQLQAAGTEAGKGVAVMGGFAAGTALAAKGLMKAGLTAAKAIPAVGAVLMAGGAIHGAVTAKSGERLKGAAKGAWDMSLPGMVVNTGMAVKEAATSTADRAPINGRLAGDQQAKFAEANAKFMAANSAAAKTETVDKNRGWSNSARIAAYQAKAEKNGFEPKNAPYGGKQSDGPSQWVTSSDPGAVAAAMKKR